MEFALAHVANELDALHVFDVLCVRAVNRALCALVHEQLELFWRRWVPFLFHVRSDQAKQRLATHAARPWLCTESLRLPKRLRHEGVGWTALRRRLMSGSPVLITLVTSESVQPMLRVYRRWGHFTRAVRAFPMFPREITALLDEDVADPGRRAFALYLSRVCAMRIPRCRVLPRDLQIAEQGHNAHLQRAGCVATRKRARGE